MIKKAFILGAGLGTRLRPMTNVRPKPLVPLFHKPMMMYAMDRALTLGIQDIAVNTHHLAAVWEEYFPTEGESMYEGLNGVASRQSSYEDARVTLFNEPELLETGGGIANIAPWIGEEDVLVYNGDIYCSIPLEPLLALHEEGQYEATLILRSEGPAQHIAIEGSRVVDIHQKLNTAEGTHQFTGIYAIKGELLKRLEPNKKESIIRVFLELAKEGKLGAVVVDEGEWFDLGTREMYLEAHATASMRPEGAEEVDVTAQIAENARVKSSWVGADVEVGRQVILENSVVWPGVKLGTLSIIKDSIVFTDTPMGKELRGEDF